MLIDFFFQLTINIFRNFLCILSSNRHIFQTLKSKNNNKSNQELSFILFCRIGGFYLLCHASRQEKPIIFLCKTIRGNYIISSTAGCSQSPLAEIFRILLYYHWNCSYQVQFQISLDLLIYFNLYTYLSVLMCYWQLLTTSFISIMMNDWKPL